MNNIRLHGQERAPGAPVTAASCQCRVTAELERQHAHAREDLARLRMLLSDAIVRLDSGWEALSTQLARSKALVAAEQEDTGEARQVEPTLENLTAVLERELWALVPALQFQDLANQIAEHIDLRVAHGQKLAGELRSCCSDTDPEVVPSRPADRVNDRITALIAETQAATARSPVAASELRPGSVELF